MNNERSGLGIFPPAPPCSEPDEIGVGAPKISAMTEDARVDRPRRLVPIPSDALRDWPYFHGFPTVAFCAADNSEQPTWALPYTLYSKKFQHGVALIG